MLRETDLGGCSRMQSLLIVVGLRSEARIAARYGRVAVGPAGLRGALAEQRPAGLVSFGLCGALDPTLAIGDLLIADAVVIGAERASADEGWTAELRARLPSGRRGDIAAGDAIVGTVAAKAALRRRSGAVAVDMESHAVALVAARHEIPFVVLRTVSDSAGHALPRAAQAGFKADGEPDVAAVVTALARRPWELPRLLLTAANAARALEALKSAARALTPPPGAGPCGLAGSSP